MTNKVKKSLFGRRINDRFVNQTTFVEGLQELFGSLLNKKWKNFKNKQSESNQKWWALTTFELRKFAKKLCKNKMTYQSKILSKVICR